MFLLDTNIILEALLEQERCEEVVQFLNKKKPSNLYITDFSIYSIGIILFKLKEYSTFTLFYRDIVKSGLNIVKLEKEDILELENIAKRYNLDFDKTDKGREVPSELL